ncbi:transposase family protein [Streptomyces sp. NPDC101230]|uniref:helix-turn-helix domain-containing protein n=1 Tax=unclassified Streptomyces TaxID=2593676 RepID=UPI0037FDEB56
MVFIDRLLAALVHLRHGATHDVLAYWFGVDRSTITCVVGEVRPLLAQRGCAIAPGVPLRNLAEVIEHLGSSGQTGEVDGTEIRVRRPAASQGSGEVHLRQEQAERRQGNGPHRRPRQAPALQPSPAG